MICASLGIDSVEATRITHSAYVKLDCTDDPRQVPQELADEWRDNLWDQLEDSGVPWIRASRAARLFSTRHCESRERAKEIFLNVLDDSRTSPRALAIVASHCEHHVMKQWCSDNHVLDKLVAADPDNAYAVLMPLLVTEEVPRIGESNDQVGYDTPQHRALLEMGSKALFYNDYAHQGALELIPVVTEYIKKVPPVTKTRSYIGHLAYKSQSAVVIAGQLTFWYSPVSLGPLKGLCRHMVIADDQWGQDRCWEVASLLRTKGRSAYIRSEGLSIGRSLLAAEDAESFISENPDYIEFRRIAIDHDCFAPKYVDYYEFSVFEFEEPLDENGEEALLSWLTDIDKVGQIRASHERGLTKCGDEFDEEGFREEHGITKEDFDYPWAAPRRSYRPKPDIGSEEKG